MLAYKSIEEAQEALGRGLTIAERIWFKYSANKSDYVLHFHNVIFFWIFYSLVPIPFILIEVYGFDKFKKFKVQQKERKSFSQMFKCYRDVMLSSLYVITPLQIMSFPTVELVGIKSDLPLPSGWEIFSQIVVYFLIEDYTSYWLHRFLHGDWLYEKIHKVHHEYKSPMALAAPYAHWAEVISLGFPAFLGPAMVPGHTVTYWLWFVLRQIEALDTHSGFDFPWSPTKYIPFYGGADYHDYHHYVGQNCKSNFASVFTYCDYLYGTDKGYRYAKEMGKKASLSYDFNAENQKVD